MSIRSMIAGRAPTRASAAIPPARSRPGRRGRAHLGAVAAPRHQLAVPLDEIAERRRVEMPDRLEIALLAVAEAEHQALLLVVVRDVERAEQPVPERERESE